MYICPIFYIFMEVRMDIFLEKLAEINDAVNGFVWVRIGLVLLIATGVLMTVVTKFFQVGRIGLWWRNTIGNMFSKDVIRHRKEKGTISPFQALCTALAATIGTGNIAGVATAISLGGAGAVFWMWVAAFFGMMTNFSENVLGLYFRRRNDKGEWSGGAMYYLKDGLGKKKGFGIIASVLAVLFCIFTLLASFGIGSMAQVNNIVANIVNAFDIPALSTKMVFGDISWYHIILGAMLMALASLIILGGLKRIANIAEKIVPFMVVLFILGSIIIVGVNYERILPAFAAIFKYALTPQAVVGGTFGAAIKIAMTQGFKRGVFSNEAGLGSSVMVHSNSSEKEPVRQGMWGIFEVFADTIVVCTMTALVVLTSGVFDFNANVNDFKGSASVLVGDAFNSVFPWFNIGEKFIAIALFLFAFTTVLGWSHYGAKAWEYLFGTKTVIVFKVIHICTIMFGAILTNSLAWDLSDTFNGLMMIPNLIAVITLAPLVMKITKNYVDRKVHNKDVKPMLSAIDEIQEEMESNLDK